MRRKFTAAVTVSALLLTSCGSGESDPSSSPTDTSRLPVGGDIPSLSAEPATINTVGNPKAGCNDDDTQPDGEKGDCYLPLFRILSQGDTARMVLTDELGAECPLDQEGVADDQSHCWPQPTTDNGKPVKVTVVCRVAEGGQVWYGIAVARTQFSNPDDSALAIPLPGDNANQVIGFNWKEFFVLDDPAAATKLALCPV